MILHPFFINIGLPLRNSATLRCVATIDPAAIEDAATDSIVILTQEDAGDTFFYCAVRPTWLKILSHVIQLNEYTCLQRIRKDFAMQQFYMSIDYTNRTNNELVCVEGASSGLSAPNPITQAQLVGLDFVALSFTRETAIYLIKFDIPVTV